MKILEQYILRRVVLMFLTALLPVLAIIWTTQVLRRINLVTDSGQSVGSFMLLATRLGRVGSQPPSWGLAARFW